MSIFCRSITAANSFPSTLQCIFGCIYGSGTTSRLKQLGMEFTVWVFKHARIDQLKLMGPVILNGILKSLDGFSSSELGTSLPYIYSLMKDENGELWEGRKSAFFFSKYTLLKVCVFKQ